jgi:hypothetical protein
VQHAHWFAAAPVHVRHDGWHVVHDVSLVAVQTALSKLPLEHVAHASHVVCPCVSWNVPAMHAGQDAAAVALLAVPAGHDEHAVAPVTP